MKCDGSDLITIIASHSEKACIWSAVEPFRIQGPVRFHSSPLRIIHFAREERSTNCLREREREKSRLNGIKTISMLPPRCLSRIYRRKKTRRIHSARPMPRGSLICAPNVCLPWISLSRHVISQFRVEPQSGTTAPLLRDGNDLYDTNVWLCIYTTIWAYTWVYALHRR